MKLRSLVGTILVVGATIIASAAVAPAQRADPFGAIDGTVVDTTGRGIGGVDVVVMGGSEVVRTNRAGAYRIDSVAPGPHLLRFRRLGLQPQTISVVTNPDDVTGVDVIMGPLVHRLDVVEVQASNGEISRVPKVFADRMRTGMGIYITPAQIVNHHAVKTSDLLRGIPGIEVVEVAYTATVRTGRGVVTINGSACSDLPVYVNDSYASGSAPALGTQASTTEGEKAAASSAAGLTAGLHGIGNLDAVDPADIVGIEVYRGPSEMPATLPPSPCGAIVIWTK